MTKLASDHDHDEQLALSYSQVPLTKNGQKMLGAKLAALIAENGEGEIIVPAVQQTMGNRQLRITFPQ